MAVQICTHQQTLQAQCVFGVLVYMYIKAVHVVRAGIPQRDVKIPEELG